jgi:prepilin-type N-terminal cleavage/methylation domain-containing protein
MLTSLSQPNQSVRNGGVSQDESTSRRDRGFTLIELLIVIVILGILATVVAFAVSGVTDRGQSGACAADRATVEVAVEAYFGKYSTLAIPSGGSGNDQYEMSIRDAGLLHNVSKLWDVDSAGGMTPQSGSAC